MSGTRSPSPRARAISTLCKRSAILVSHGQPSEPDVAEAELGLLRDSVATLLPEQTLLSATMASRGALASALEQAGPDPLIYPVFMTDGWFTQTALPQRLGGASARILPPLGVDPSLPQLAAGLLRLALAGRQWDAADTCLIIAAHGSGRSTNAARDTRTFAKALQRLMAFGEIRVGFIEEPPLLADILRDGGKKAACLPFFAARRDHVLDDLPKAFEQAHFQGLRLNPLGLHPSIPQLIANALTAALSEEIAA
ncbi:MAG: CbiX/SirB N-terminal domain-containing protein [Stappiaceae bacterium]